MSIREEFEKMKNNYLDLKLKIESIETRKRVEKEIRQLAKDMREGK